jgi:hypothetical protein
MKRACNTCAMLRKVRKPAEFVASDATGLSWYECADHAERDNVAEVLRTRRKPIALFFEQAGIPYEDLDDLEEPPPATERGHRD